MNSIKMLIAVGMILSSCHSNSQKQKLVSKFPLACVVTDVLVTVGNSDNREMTDLYSKYLNTNFRKLGVSILTIEDLPINDPKGDCLIIRIRSRYSELLPENGIFSWNLSIAGSSSSLKDSEFLKRSRSERPLERVFITKLFMYNSKKWKDILDSIIEEVDEEYLNIFRRIKNS